MLFSEVQCDIGNGHVGAPQRADKHTWVTFEWCQIGSIQAVIYIGARSPTEGQAANQTSKSTANDTYHKAHI